MSHIGQNLHDPQGVTACWDLTGIGSRTQADTKSKTMLENNGIVSSCDLHASYYTFNHFWITYSIYYNVKAA